LEGGRYRTNGTGQRMIKTSYGSVSYVRHYLVAKEEGGGFFPLDVELEVTRDGFSPWVIQMVTWLATQSSYQDAQAICKRMWGWAPSTEALEQLVLGLGRQAAVYMEAALSWPEDGEVLVIETDGKCTPTATASELEKRRGKRRARSCTCGCQRHRGRCERHAAGPRKRRKKGDKSKNGREAMIVVMYTLRRGPDGLLHGPVNKKIWASYAGRLAAARWARDQATRRGFPPGTDKLVQIVMDGAKGLKQNFQAFFPQAIFTLDVCHVEEKLWQTGHAIHSEGSPELKAWVQRHLTDLYGGRVPQLVESLKQQHRQVSSTGPGTKGRRTALAKVINYLEPRVGMMRYAEWREQDLVLASGQVEGAARHVVGQRLDGPGMRWIPGRAEPLLNLRCIAINGDWESFIEWAYRGYGRQLQTRQPTQIRTNQALVLKLAA
jgi:hypothetical protein